MAQQRPRRSYARDEELERSYRKVTGGKYRKRKKKLNKISSILIVCIAVLFIGAIIAGGIYIYDLDQNSLIADGVIIAGVDVGGKNKSDAIDAVSEATQDTYTKEPMRVKVLDTEIEIKAYISQAKLDVRKAVKAAFKQTAPGPVDLTPYLNLDEAAIRKALDELGKKYSSTLSKSVAEVTGTAPNHVLVVTLGTPEYGLDMNELYNNVLQAYSNNVFFTEGKCKLIEPQPINLQTYLDDYYIEPKDARFELGTFEIIDAVDGYGFDIEQATKQLEAAAPGSKVEIPFVPLKAPVTAEVLRGILYRDTLYEHTATEKTSDDDRNTNLRLACEAIDGLIIYPGDTFSYNNALGARTAAKGYRPGPAYESGRVIKSIGGGICQVSSVLYYCALMADLEILTRQNHGYSVAYMDPGMDAAVSWGSLDFCFRNNTNYPIKIEAEAKGNATTVRLLGTDEKDYYIKLRYEVSNENHYQIKYEDYPANNAEGYKDGDIIQDGHTGCVVVTYRAKYDKKTNAMISEVEEDTSYYSRLDAIACRISDSSAGPDQGIGNGAVTEDGSL